MIDKGDIGEVTCVSCGREFEGAVKGDTVDGCHECCEHEHVRSELTGDYCEDCGAKVN